MEVGTVCCLLNKGETSIKHKEINQDELYDLYINQQLTQREVGKILGISQTQVRRELSKAGIKSRNASESRQTPDSIQRRKKNSERYKKEYTIWREKKCEWCGKTFIVDGAHKHKKFCSKQCLRKSQKAKRTKYYCKLCGKEIVMNDRHYKRIYCDDCLSEWRKHLPSKRIHTNCAYCGAPLEVIPAVYQKNKFNYCNVDCMAKHYSLIYTGENSPSWKGGKGHHYIGGFWSARRKVRERDNFTCQLCGITEEEYGQQLSVHHIKNYRDFEDKEEANQLDNLISLCEPCHRFIHSNANTEKIFIKE